MAANTSSPWVLLKASPPKSWSTTPPPALASSRVPASPISSLRPRTRLPSSLPTMPALVPNPRPSTMPLVVPSPMFPPKVLVKKLSPAVLPNSVRLHIWHHQFPARIRTDVNFLIPVYQSVALLPLLPSPPPASLSSTTSSPKLARPPSDGRTRLSMLPARARSRTSRAVGRTLVGRLAMACLRPPGGMHPLAWERSISAS